MKGRREGRREGARKEGRWTECGKDMGGGNGVQGKVGGKKELVKEGLQKLLFLTALSLSRSSR